MTMLILLELVKLLVLRYVATPPALRFDDDDTATDDVCNKFCFKLLTALDTAEVELLDVSVSSDGIDGSVSVDNAANFSVVEGNKRVSVDQETIGKESRNRGRDSRRYYWRCGRVFHPPILPNFVKIEFCTPMFTVGKTLKRRRKYLRYRKECLLIRSNNEATLGLLAADIALLYRGEVKNTAPDSHSPNFHITLTRGLSDLTDLTRVSTFTLRVVSSIRIRTQDSTTSLKNS
ncbi:hypothetical protein TNCV_2732141 [Trichonephila clavipes]|nr:hypothetical protein TNCV_2732141 [Trichonephila clavipes]